MRAHRVRVGHHHRWDCAEEEGEIDETDSTIAPVHVLAVDDQPQFRNALRRLVERFSALAVVAEVASGEAAVHAVRQLKPDLVVMDVRMPGLGGIGATRAIKRMRPETVVLLVSSTLPDELPPEADDCLADAIVWKGALCSGVLAEIWARHAGQSSRRAGGPRQQSI